MSTRSLRARDYLAHMTDAIKQIQTYIGKQTKAEFVANRLLQDAVIRKPEVLDEAARCFLAAVPNASEILPGIPFSAIYAMRNQLSHGYFTVDLDVVWNVIESDLPELQIELEAAWRGFNETSAG